MAKSAKKDSSKKAPGKKPAGKKVAPKKADGARKKLSQALVVAAPVAAKPMPPLALGASSAVLDRLWAVVSSRREADPAISHSARLLQRGTAKIAQKFGEEAVECLIEATLGNPEALVGESADVLYHLIVMWVDAGIRPEDVWAELQRREGVSGIAEKASRARKLPMALGMRTTKIP
ncbi:phosphoribosyl-ATP diphosphatase [Limobrevibacterium gyesilva]|uniref:Phosphoribosyl-ATP pyrophosphatase n=1 Tax=Limobrevibacterium gyesilva TaxID=2991712 RepID=A0AA41YQH8_9PROT|nr:phosphoribosyl-ATP diphosphatase [Limobrevibacterium gyesilva]MCW3474625.1 phosphoribosyl-ATP diphosphatase [Limobrevibacterium gyesilva]